MAKSKGKTKECILAIDAGTQSIRAANIDLKGNIVDLVKTPIEPYFSVNPGWAEQKPEYFWKTLSVTCRKLMQNSSFNKDFIKGVTITTQRSTLINLDVDGKPLRPAMIWLDQRRAELEKWPPFYLKALYKSVNVQEAIEFGIKNCEANWIRQNEPHIWDKTHKFLFLSGYLTYRLTGEFVDSAGCQVGFVPYDFRTHDWANESHRYWKMFPMDKSILPDLVQPSEIMGYISKKASVETGIPRGLPVIAAATDKACEVLGSGCLSPETACLSYGTTATVETTNEKYVEIVPFIPPFPSAVPGSYNTEVMIYRGYWMISWFKKEFGLREVEIAKKRKIPPEKLFDDIIKDIPPGSMGLTLQPYWTPGVKIPGPEAKGAIIGFGDVHTRAHIYRAILEGIAYALKEGSIRTSMRNKVKINKIRVSGGGSQSDVAMQLTADIFDLPVERPHTYETSALGAAIDAAVGLGMYRNFRVAVNEMTRVGEQFKPIPENRDVYKELFEKVYLKMYGRLKNIYDDIRNITGYPEKK
ncbi:FGGY-family carbohydrate kinase [Spirochaetota bacterium]